MARIAQEGVRSKVTPKRGKENLLKKGSLEKSHPINTPNTIKEKSDS